MIKKIIILFLFQATCFACPEALPTNHANFCPSFKASAVCYCTSSGLPNGVCKDVNFVYRRMISFFGTLERACQHQSYTGKQNCIDNWNCFLHGGLDSRGQACSATQKSCALV